MKAITELWVKANKDKRFTIKFENGTELKNIKLFTNSSGMIGYLQGRAKRMGKYFPMYDTITSITEIVKKETTDIQNAKTIIGRIHPNSWTELRAELQDIVDGGKVTDNFDWHFKGKLNFRNIKSLLGTCYAERLKQAFENKSEFTWHKGGSGNNGRDLSISTRLCEDGVFRAWFSSEYIGCGNGDYYLLINPTTARY